MTFFIMVNGVRFIGELQQLNGIALNNIDVLRDYGKHNKHLKLVNEFDEYIIDIDKIDAIGWKRVK